MHWKIGLARKAMNHSDKRFASQSCERCLITQDAG